MLKNYDIIFLCLAKNVEGTIHNLFNFQKQIKNNNISALILIGENDSSDNTVSIVEKFAKKNNDNDIVLIKTDHINIYKNRIERLTHGRNYLKTYVMERNIKSTYISIVDVDNVLETEPDIETFKKILKILIEKKNELFGISAKSKPFYYDMLNLFITDFYEKDVLKIQNNKNILKSYFLRKKNIYNFQNKITNIKKDIKAVSAHNGFCVYLYDDYMLGNYLDKKSNIRGKDSIIPEHIIINKSIHKKTGKNMLISKDFFVKTPNEHMPYFTLKLFVSNKIKYFLSKFLINR